MNNNKLYPLSLFQDIPLYILLNETKICMYPIQYIFFSNNNSQNSFQLIAAESTFNTSFLLEFTNFLYTVPVFEFPSDGKAFTLGTWPGTDEGIMN